MKFTITEQDKADMCRIAPEFSEVARDIELEDFECSGDLFTSLVESVVYQQLSGRVAEAIYGRFKNLLGTVTPGNILNASAGALRDCGLSARKASYLRGIAEASLSGVLDFGKLAAMPDAEVTAELVKLKGVGPWTAEMLLIFSLGRRDVLSCRDLGVRRGMMKLYNIDEVPEEKFEFYRRRCSPHGTLATLYLWRIADGQLAK